MTVAEKDTAHGEGVGSKRRCHFDESFQVRSSTEKCLIRELGEGRNSFNNRSTASTKSGGKNGAERSKNNKMTRRAEEGGAEQKGGEVPRVHRVQVKQGIAISTRNSERF